MPRPPWNLTAKLGAIGGALLLMALASIGLTLWVTWQLEGGAAAVNEAGRMRMQTWRLAQTLAAGDAARAAGAAAQQFDQSLALLRSGDPSRPLFVPHDARSQAAFADVQRGWQALRAALGRRPARRRRPRPRARPRPSSAASTPSSRPSRASSRAGRRCSTPSSSR